MGLLKISPEKTLEFPPSLYSSSAIEIQLENITKDFVAFKIKTTAPKAYLVKPSTGIIASGQVQRVQIVVQAAADCPKSPCNDRFLIQATTVASDQSVSRDFWNDLCRDRLEEHRLSVAFRGSQYSSQHHPEERSYNEGSPPFSQGMLSGNADMKKHYELLNYTLSLEKHKEESQKTIESLKKQVAKLQSSPPPSSSKNVFSYLLELWHLPLYLLVVVVLWYFFYMSADIPTPDSIN